MSFAQLKARFELLDGLQRRRDRLAGKTGSVVVGNDTLGQIAGLAGVDSPASGDGSTKLTIAAFVELIDAALDNAT